MATSSTKTADAPPARAPDGPDRLSLKGWLAFYAGWLAALAAPAAWILHRLGVRWKDLFVDPARFTDPVHAVGKLLIFAAYLSLCCTFLPLPTGWLVSALATREVALSESFAVTVLLVATVGAAASTVANLHDYHLFTWMLRHRRIARVRETRLYEKSARWFARQPFTLLVVFNIVPIPVDVVRMLAATYRYPLRPFAAANFAGRWVRYGVIAAVTFWMGDRGWLISAALLAVAVVLGLGRVGARLWRRAGKPGKAAPSGGSM